MVHLKIQKPFNKKYFYLRKCIYISKNKRKCLSVYFGNKKPSKEEIEKATKLLEYEAEKLGLIKKKSKKEG